MQVRGALKQVLSRLPDGGPASGASLLIWHRIGGGTTDEMDSRAEVFAAALDLIVATGSCTSLDDALDRLARGDDRPSLVLTFDDGFADVHANAFPLLRERALPFTLYVVAGLIGGSMRWEGSIGAGQGAPALSWEQVREMHDSGLCTVGNHTYSHARPEAIDEAELDKCSDAIEAHLGARPRHFAWPWGIEVPALRSAVEERFRSVATAELGRNPPGHDMLALRRIPVRRSDPASFIRAKLRGNLRAERAYAVAVGLGKRSRDVGARS